MKDCCSIFSLRNFLDEPEVDSKIEENRCRQTMWNVSRYWVIYSGIYHKLPLTAIIHLPLFTCFNNKNSKVLLLCIFEMCSNSGNFLLV